MADQSDITQPAACAPTTKRNRRAYGSFACRGGEKIGVLTSRRADGNTAVQLTVNGRVQGSVTPAQARDLASMLLSAAFIAENATADELGIDRAAGLQDVQAGAGWLADLLREVNAATERMVAEATNATNDEGREPVDVSIDHSELAGLVMVFLDSLSVVNNAQLFGIAFALGELLALAGDGVGPGPDWVPLAAMGFRPETGGAK